MMSRLITLWRIMVAGTRNFFRNAWLTVAATVVMVITLTVMLTGVILNFAIKDTLAQVTERIDVAIYIDDSAIDEQVVQLQTELQKLENVQSIKVVSKTEALARYRSQNKDNPVALEAVTDEENPLPRSLELQVKDLNLIDPILEVTKQEAFAPIVQDTSLGEDRRKTVRNIANLNTFVVNVGIIGSLIFATVAILIIFNTIRIAIFSRAEEIQIMRLIGATNSYIRGPFLFESILDGVMAALISLSLVYIVLFGIGPNVRYINLGNTVALFETYWPLVGLITIIAGMLIGIISSTLAMARYLKL